MTSVRIGSQIVTFTNQMEIGQGNEAYIYIWDNKRVVKVYKLANDPSYKGSPNEQNERKMATERLKVVQTKLPEYPKGLPKNMVVPEELGYDPKSNSISAYVMKSLVGANLLKDYATPEFRQKVSFTNPQIVQMFKKFKPTVQSTHARDVVLADFTLLNNMVLNSEIYIVDADAAQFGRYLTNTFTAYYVDPRICDPNATKPMMIRPHDKLSDWYAFCVMLFECLTLTNPVFGGTYKASGPKDMVKDGERGIKHITVFHPQVRYPKRGVPLDSFPKQALTYFKEVFIDGRRDEFPDHIFEALLTGRPAVASIPIDQQLVVIRGKVTATQEFVTRGQIVYATIQNGKLRLIYHEDGKFRRENKSVAFEGKMDPTQRIRIQGNLTIVGKENQMTRYQPTLAPYTELSESFVGGYTQIDANARHRYWLRSGQLYHDSPYGEEYIGDVFLGQTQFWVGPEFGFGFYRAGGVTVGFVFDAERKGMNDKVNIPQITGQITAATCVFSHEYAWFLYTAKEGSDVKNFAVVIDKGGNIIGQGYAIEGDGSWLSTIRGKCPVGQMLFAPTDVGVVKVDIIGNELVQSQVFPD
ncbi:hypothetical protein KBA63_01125, partial [Candidatus Woesebacteria bacterium]|nr:hypothetical protein [Candidatus Woesebacteria bacterium]